MPDGDTQTPGQEPNSSTTTTEPSGSGRSIDAFPEEAQDYIRRLRDEAARHRNEAKEARNRAAQLEDQNKTEAQRQADQAAADKARADAAEARLLRFEVAAEKGIPLQLAGRLQGSTKEELSADADKLRTDFGIAEGDSGSTAGGPSFDGGVRRPAPKPKGMNGLIRQASGR